MDAILRVDNLTKQYADFKLDHVSFSVPKGTIMGLIGENGAGKSTTINAILDLIHKDDGTVTFWGQGHLSLHPKSAVWVCGKGRRQYTASFSFLWTEI